jgi:hypothetical protein
MSTSRRALLAGVAAIAAAAALPFVARAHRRALAAWRRPSPLGEAPTAQEWEDRESLNAPWARLSSKFPAGSWQQDDDLETQAFVQAFRPFGKIHRNTRRLS